MHKLIGIALLLVLIAACQKNGDAVFTEKPQSKKIEFHVHASPQYTNPAFNAISAEVKLAIYKINFGNGQNQLLWDTTFAARPLADYPHLPEKFLIEKEYGVLESQEKLQANYNIRYRAPEGISQELQSDELGPGNHFVFLDVAI